jgi:hypothetical protein
MQKSSCQLPITAKRGINRLVNALAGCGIIQKALTVFLLTLPPSPKTPTQNPHRPMNPLPRPTNRLIPDPIARLFQVKNDVKESSDERMSSIANLREDAGFEGGIGAFEAESEGKGGGAGEAICRG